MSQLVPYGLNTLGNSVRGSEQAATKFCLILWIRNWIFTTIRAYNIQSCDVWHLFARIPIFNRILRHLNFHAMTQQNKYQITKYERFVICFKVVFSIVLHFFPHIFSFEKITCIIMTCTTHYFNVKYEFCWRAFAFEVSKEQPLTSNL